MSPCQQAHSSTGELLEQLDDLGGTTIKFREQLAAEAFDHTALYDRAIADFMRGDSISGEFPASLNLSMRRKAQLRYGENPHQRAALYSDPAVRSASLVAARQLSGKELSYNNLLDLDAALEIVRGFARPSVSVHEAQQSLWCRDGRFACQCVSQSVGR